MMGVYENIVIEAKVSKWTGNVLMISLRLDVIVSVL